MILYLFIPDRLCYYQGLTALRKNLGDSHLKRLEMTKGLFAALVDNIYSPLYVPQEDVVKVYKDVILLKFESLLKSSHQDIVKNKPGITIILKKKI